MSGLARTGRRGFFTLCLSLLTMFGIAATARAQSKLRVGILKIGGQTNAWVAREQGLFGKRGLDVDLTFIRSGSEGVAAMQGGSLDMIISIPGFAIIGNERGLGLVMVLQNQVAAKTPPDSAALLVGADSGITSLAQLAGKLVGINALHAQEVVSAQHLIRKAGVPRDQIKYIETPYAAMGEALKRGDVAAIVPVEPFVTTTLQRGIGKVAAWAYNEAVPEQPTGAYFAKRAWAEANRKSLALYREAIDEANAWLLSDTTRARAAVSQFTGLAPELVAAMPLIPWSTKVDASKWAALVSLLREEGEIEKDQKPEDFILELEPAK